MTSGSPPQRNPATPPGRRRALAWSMGALVGLGALAAALGGPGGMAAAGAVGAMPVAVAPADAAAPAGASASRVVRPVPGEVVGRFHPPATRYGAGHRGVDLAAEPGDVVRAAMAGTVAFSGAVARVGWVTVDHGGGLRTTYGALDPRGARPGQRVRAGAPLGRLAGGAAHLDWGALLHGAYIDPLSLLGRWEVHLTR